MLFAEAVYLGIDPSAGVKPCHYAAIDKNLKLIGLDKGDMEEVLSYAGGIEYGIVAIDAPASLSQALLARPEVRRSFGLPERGRTWRNWKVGEFELRRRNIRLYRTPVNAHRAPKWMQQGFRVHQRLRKMGFRPFSGEEHPADRALVEINPQACFTVLLKRKPFPKQTLEGRLQRQLVLFLEGLDIPNPMLALEEITRHHLLSGHMPMDMLFSHQALDALMAAYTAYLVSESGDRICQVGEPSEGLITLPLPELQDFYP